MDHAWTVSSQSIGENGHDDTMFVGTLLKAAGVDNGLETSMREHSRKHDWTLRHGGVVLMLRIHYDNTWARKYLIFPDTDKYRYRYQVGYQLQFLAYSPVAPLHLKRGR